MMNNFSKLIFDWTCLNINQKSFRALHTPVDKADLPINNALSAVAAEEQIAQQAKLI